MQARVVRASNSSTNSDSVRDRDAEKAWCDEYHRLQERIVSAGGSVVLKERFRLENTS